MKNKWIIGVGLILIIFIGVVIFKNTSSPKTLVTSATQSQQVITQPSPSPSPNPKVTIDSSTNLKELTNTLQPEDFSLDYRTLKELNL